MTDERLGLWSGVTMKSPGHLQIRLRNTITYVWSCVEAPLLSVLLFNMMLHLQTSEKAL